MQSCDHNVASYWRLPSRSSSSSSSLCLPCLLQQWVGSSVGFNVERVALLKAPVPISLLQMHRVSLKFHANCHVLFKQLRGYPQKEAGPPFSALLVSFAWNKKAVVCRTALSDWDNIRNIWAARFTLFKWVQIILCDTLYRTYIMSKCMYCLWLITYTCLWV